MLMSSAEKKRLRTVARKAAREPSALQLAKEKARNGAPHPAITGTSTPAGIEANDRDAWEFQGFATPPKPIVSQETKPGKAEPFRSHVAGEAVEIGIDLCHEHPENRDSKDSDPDVKELAASIDKDDQLQPIMVRQAPAHWKLPDGHFQIVFGERRWRACRVAGLQSVRGVIRTDLDDATTRRLIVIENAKRKDLNPIQKARLIETLCSPNQDGSDGLTREAAAKEVGLESGSAASNLVRLLKLPKVWQDRVAADELPESFARLLVPLLPAPSILAALDANWKQAFGPKGKEFQRDNWQSRQGVEELIDDALRGNCRPIESSHTRHWGGDIRGPQGDEYRYSGYHPRRFELTPELEQQLEIIEWRNICFDGVGGYNKPVRMATNAKLYDKLNVPLIKAHVDKHKKGKAAKAGADKPAPKKELTPAQQRAREKEQAGQLQKRIEGWRHAWLKSLVAREVSEDAALRERLLIALALHEIDLSFSKFEALPEAVVATAKQEGAGSSDAYEALVELGNKIAGLRDCGTALVQAALHATDSDPRYPAIPFEQVDEMATFAGIDLAAEWVLLQESAKVDDNPRWEEFFLLFQTGQLDQLGDELGVYVGGVNGKAAKIKLLMSKDRRLPLPKCIKPLAGAKPAKGKAAKKR
jgi:ParB/RepB/Spo0J family partition protein